MKDFPEAVNAQILMAKEDYKNNYGRDPKGIWLSECAYYPGQDKYLEKNNFSFWNLGHPYMQYKFDLGATSFSREEFLKRWLLICR